MRFTKVPTDPCRLQQFVARAIGAVDEPVVRLATRDDHVITGVVLDCGRIVPRAVFMRPQSVPNDTLLVDRGSTAQKSAT